ncbi:MAG TPA: hypothetical protein VGI70_03020 [Polyangiales bacterium]|jgi:hypothetical protein
MSLRFASLGSIACLVIACEQPPLIIGPKDGDFGRLKPELTLLLDTSASMNRRWSCDCVTPDCSECLPNCDNGEKSRWFELLAALTGSFQDYSCNALARTRDNGATYDVNASVPIYRLGDDVQQQADGILDRYADRVNFGVATFDSVGSYLGAPDLVPMGKFDPSLNVGMEGEYSFGGVGANGIRIRPDGTLAGRVQYPGAGDPYLIDTGIVQPNGAEGGLILASSNDDEDAVNDRIKDELRAQRPFGSSPTAAALDDLYYAYQLAGFARAKRYVLLISDGRPDDDYRSYPFPGCDCAAEGNCPPNEDPAQMSCPYPTASDAALHLYCGFDTSYCGGPIAKLLTLSVGTSANGRPPLEALAANGGGIAYFADSVDDIEGALERALSEVIADADADADE